MTTQGNNKDKPIEPIDTTEKECAEYESRAEETNFADCGSGGATASKRLLPENGNHPARRSSVGATRHSDCCGDSPATISDMASPPLAVSKKTTPKKGRGRPSSSGNIRLRPVLRDPPDLQKLGRAILKLVGHLAEAEDSKDVAAEQEEQHAA